MSIKAIAAVPEAEVRWRIALQRYMSAMQAEKRASRLYDRHPGSLSAFMALVEARQSLEVAKGDVLGAAIQKDAG
ncbi:hypothetical protein PSQ90_07790 [Devosia rhodophyticola]|uniref:Uncharacterized protein n=1 Tax=Devosia rhodophyticola TaxID=3026423 RepID=A0ABY7Z1H8_9HYPH|nr:hypothetical protein [Devosia rhodophyticola]WDR07309.1 hypothetical protein PSQ90_07790 [Devosia rhodophyticola]